jgi:hypothetical protein
VAGVGKVCGLNDEFDLPFEIADKFDLGKTCAVSHPEKIFFSVSLYCSFMATAHPRNHFNSVIEQIGQSAKWLGIQTFIVTSRMALGPGSCLFSQG